ncbi:cytochrome c5 family protein [Pigmentiphaga sp. NML080357]|uniref:c-type cytochrome n=1 Tax=Pigmentiphaga sp. NML080357 TaxID=2008675 RepID=UPI000B40DA2E|nr:c-type cytochrome [Pigmentiphaga sp. NML080357]OVZ55189.1 cytochrome c5 family protein [Pigmentiphaga sp. NML080357]
MSNAQHNHSEEHTSPIRTPRQLITVVILAFLVPIIVILLLVNFVASGTKSNAGSDAQTPEAIEARIKPVGGFELRDANAPRVFQTGEAVYKAVCSTCHAAGVAGAPKFGDNASWAKFIATGFDAMLQVAIHGKGAMPAKGGNPDLDDFEVARAVVYMANHSGGNFKEPAEPAPAAPAAEGQAPAEAAAPAAPAAPAPQAAAPAPAPQAAAPAPQAAAPAAASTADGKKLYDSTCFACHGTGVAGAPKFGDKAAWAKYIATGMDAMVSVAMQGKGAMPPKGGAANASEAEIRAAVQYMVDAAK